MASVGAGFLADAWSRYLYTPVKHFNFISFFNNCQPNRDILAVGDTLSVGRDTERAQAMYITKTYRGSVPEFWIHRDGMAHGPINTYEAALTTKALLERIYG